jgi:hypothetical protein
MIHPSLAFPQLATCHEQTRKSLKCLYMYVHDKYLEDSLWGGGTSEANVCTNVAAAHMDLVQTKGGLKTAKMHAQLSA